MRNWIEEDIKNRYIEFNRASDQRGCKRTLSASGIGSTQGENHIQQWPFKIRPVLQQLLAGNTSDNPVIIHTPSASTAKPSETALSADEIQKIIAAAHKLAENLAAAQITVPTSMDAITRAN